MLIQRLEQYDSDHRRNAWARWSPLLATFALAVSATAAAICAWSATHRHLSIRTTHHHWPAAQDERTASAVLHGTLHLASFAPGEACESEKTHKDLAEGLDAQLRSLDVDGWSPTAWIASVGHDRHRLNPSSLHTSNARLARARTDCVADLIRRRICHASIACEHKVMALPRGSSGDDQSTPEADALDRAPLIVWTRLAKDEPR